MEWDVSYLTGPEFFLLIVILVSCRGQFFLFSSVGSSFFYIGDVDVVAVASGSVTIESPDNSPSRSGALQCFLVVGVPEDMSR